MKILLLSDIHSNIHALKTVEAAEAPFDLVLCAGDLIDWGMDPKPVVEWMRSHKHVAVQGNHESYLLSAEENRKRVEMRLEKLEGTYSIDPDPVGREGNFMTYTMNQLNEEEKDYLRSLPQAAVVDADGYTYYLTHSENETKQDAVLGAMTQNCSQKLFDALWEAHTGRPDVFTERDYPASE